MTTTGRAARGIAALLAVVAILVSIGATPAAAASGGGCAEGSSSVASVGVCISYRGSDKSLLPDIYVHSTILADSSWWWHVEIQRADGATWVNANYTHEGNQHYGPTRHPISGIGAGGTVRTLVRLESLGCCGGSVTWAGPFYSPWVSYP